MGGATLPTSSVLRMVGDGARHMATDSFERRVTFGQDGRRPPGRQLCRSSPWPVHQKIVPWLKSTTFDMIGNDFQWIGRSMAQSPTNPNTIALPRVPRLEFSTIGAGRSDGDVGMVLAAVRLPSQECALT